MAAITPRASGLWQDSTMTYSRLSTHDAGDDLDDAYGGEIDSRTPLDRTIDQIGMGTYQWALLFLCGFGWLADNMWMQAVAIILPRVQQHFSLPDNQIGLLSSAMFAGMMFGAVGWGTCSDLMGRSTAFNATLFFTSLFGVFSSLATTFPMLCASLFFLGSAVGGSLPTDGTLLLEHMPRGKEYLVTALSVFFSFGAVLASLVAILLIPKNTCDPSPAPCDLDRNLGWKYELVALGLITFAMFLGRMVFFRLHESPRYLVHAGRPQDAIEALQMISKFNGSELELDLEDVEDRIRVPPAHLQDPSVIDATENRSPSSRLFDVDAEAAAAASSPTDIKALTHPGTPLSSTPPDGAESALLIKDYSATGGSAAPLAAYAVVSAAERRSYAYHSTPEAARDSFRGVLPPLPSPPKQEEVTAGDLDVPPSPLSPLPSPSCRPARSSSYPSPSRGAGAARRRSRRDTLSSVCPSLYEAADQAYWALPRSIRRPVRAWLARFRMVLEPEWRRTTVLVWGVWWGTSLAFTMFNVFLPKLLETRRHPDAMAGGRGGSVSGGVGAAAAAAASASLERTLWDVVIFTLGGCPGAVVGAWLIEWPRLGRKLSLAGSLFSTALLCVIFGLVEHPLAVTASTVGISLSSSVMWAVLYGWTPEIFATKVRGTACGAASALSRVGGMIAPILGGTLLMIDPSFPVYASIVVFVLSGICVLLIKETRG
ncbi:major facilitator superfamily domain-containing protein, partial [Russula compacta]